jgi:ABC-type branched-subunit amino acid transport system substrate-binding protein
MTRPKAFPPGFGWIPLSIALIAAVTLSVVSIAPQFRTQVTSQTVAGGGGGGTDGGVAGPSGAAAAGPGGGAGAPGGTTIGHGGGPAQGASCGAGRNGGATAPGVTGNEIHIASTEVTTGVGSGFLGEATQGMLAAIDQANNAGGICGRQIVLDHVNDGWQGTVGQQDIGNYINSGNVFALVGEPDSEGLAAAIDSKTIDNAGMPVVGSDGMLADQYFDPWVWPVAASTVTNMHVVADYAVNTLKAHSFGIVYDTSYKFGAEGATAFDKEIQRLTGKAIPGDGSSGCSGSSQFCGVTSNNTDYGNAINAFNSGCAPCDVVVLLLEPGPAEAWMNQEKNASSSWYKHLMGGEPLFDANFGSNCDTCGGMVVWTGYHPYAQPFDTEAAVATFTHALKARCPSCDAGNEFTEGAYLGAELFIAACKQVGADLTRSALQHALDSMSFNSGIAQPLSFGSGFPRVANDQMAAFADNFSGSFNGWSYLNTGFIRDRTPTSDFR